MEGKNYAITLNFPPILHDIYSPVNVPGLVPSMHDCCLAAAPGAINSPPRGREAWRSRSGSAPTGLKVIGERAPDAGLKAPILYGIGRICPIESRLQFDRPVHQVH